MSILVSVLFGYSFGFTHHMYLTRKPIEIIEDINQKVCTVDIIEVTNNHIKGKVGEKDIRIRYDSEIIFPNTQGIFEISY